MSFLSGKKNEEVANVPVVPPVPSVPGNVPMSEVMEYAKSFLGTLYQWGGDFKRWTDGKDFGLDCSGFEQAIAKYQGIDESGDQTADGILDWYLKKGAKVIPFGEEEPGDRVFYEGATVDGRWTHIALVVGKNKIIGANGGGSANTTAEYSRKHGACVRYDALNYRKDKHIIVRPVLPSAIPVQKPTPLPTQVVGGPVKADWDGNPKAAQWTDFLLKALKTHGKDLLAMKNIADSKTWCPSFSSLTEDQKLRFFVMLISSMCRYESGFKPETTYKEDFNDAGGENVISRGLLQVSVESSNSYLKKAGLPSVTAADLHDAYTNLMVGVVILNRWIPQDGVIASGDNKGGGRYWSVLRALKSGAPRDSYVNIVKKVNALAL